MNRLLSFFFLFLCFSGFAQSFRLDPYGRVASDPRFKMLLASRKYKLIGTFDSIPASGKGRVALALKGDTWIYLDLNGKEYGNYSQLARAYGLVPEEPDEMPGVDEPPLPVPGMRARPVMGPYQEGNKQGFKYNGKIIVQPKYDQAKQLNVPGMLYVKVRNEELYGICDYQGKVIVPLIYSEISVLESFSGGDGVGFLVRKDKKYGVLGLDASVLIPVSFDGITLVAVDYVTRIKVRQDKLYGMYTKTGKQLIAPVYENIDLIQGGTRKLFFRAVKDGRHGILSRTGEVSIPFTFNSPLYYSPGQSCMIFTDPQNGNKLGAIDTSGRVILPAVYKSIYQPPNANCIFASIVWNKTGIYDNSGKMIADSIYYSREAFDNDPRGERHPQLYTLSLDREGTKKGLFNVRTLEWVFPCEYSFRPSEGKYVVAGKPEAGGYLYGLIDRKGKFVIPLQYSAMILQEDEGLVAVKKDDKFGVFSLTNKEIIPFKYELIVPLRAVRPDLSIDRTLLPWGRFVFMENGRVGLTDLQQNVIIPANYKDIVPGNGALTAINGDTYTILSFTGKDYFSAETPVKEVVPGIFNWYDAQGLCHGADLYGGRMASPPPVPGINYNNYSDPVPPPPAGALVIIQETIYEFTDIPAEFPGGGEAMNSFISKIMHYPETAAEEGIQGKCYLKFTVSAAGKISDVKVLRGISGCPECDREAKRVIKIMPAWIPAKIKNEAVASYVTIPVTFRLNP